MARKNHTPGSLYVASDTEYKGKFKIGYTEKEVSERLAELNRHTSQLGILKEEWSAKVDSIELAEDIVHYLLRSYRVRKEREYFEIPLSRAIKVCEYVSRTLFETQVVKQKFSKSDWDDLITSYKEKYLRDAINLCLKEGKVGEPNRKRFGSLRYNFKGFDLISLYFTKNHIRVHTHVKIPAGEKLIRKQFPKSKAGDIDLREWGSERDEGYSFKVQNQVQFEILKSWLELGKKLK